MLEHTLDRAKNLVIPERIITVISNNQRHYFNRTLKSEYGGKLIEQPSNGGTLTAIFLAAAYILQNDPQATLLILPSDHFVYPEEKYVQYAELAMRQAEECEDRIVLLGAEAYRAESDYGWIETSGKQRKRAQVKIFAEAAPVKNFHEKPTQKEAENLYRSGAIWNTMITAVKAKTLWAFGKWVMPQTMEHFENFRVVLHAVSNGLVPSDHENICLSQLFQNIPQMDFSSDFLQKVAQFILTVSMEDLVWSDWGRPERLIDSVEQMDFPTNFPKAIYR
jgi:mannose-1-phosphate guanylyltransferase